MVDTRIVTAPNVAPVLQVATGDVDTPQGSAVYDTALYDTPTALYAGLDADWSDEGCDAIEAVCYLGRQRSVDVFDIGTATVTVRNVDGRWDYPPPQPAPSPLELRPGRQIRVGVIVDGVDYTTLWHGWIDAMTPTYTPNPRRDTVQIDAVCAKGEFGRVSAPAVSPPIAAGESITTRMVRYANLAGFPAHRRDFDPSTVTLAATPLGGRLGALADASATSAGGDVFGDRNGFLRYAGADWRARLDFPLDGAVGNRGVDDEVCPDAWEIVFARSDYSTRINYGRAGEAASTIDDVPNQVRYGVETWDMTSLETLDDAVVDRLGERVAELRSFDLAPRVAAVHLNAARPGAAALMAAIDPFTPTMLACGLVQAGRLVFARAMYVTGVEHTITAGSWTARVALDDASPWLQAPVSRYDAANYDVDRYSDDPT